MTDRKNNARNALYQIGKTVDKKTNHDVLETRREREKKLTKVYNPFAELIPHYFLHRCDAEFLLENANTVEAAYYNRR
jgi:hypothetical protein